ncbi:MAG: dTDP-glucose 4,6-dehydratase [Terriglobales bacterium]
MTRWLITGGAGFIGSNFIRLALKHEADLAILNFDALTYAGRGDNLKDLEDEPRYRFVRGDVCEAAAVEEAMAEFAPELVIHCAAESHVDRSIAEAAAFVRSNVLGTQVMLDAARRHHVRRYVQISTDEVYGSLAPAVRAREDAPLAPNSPYAASKAAGEHLVRAAGQTFGLPAIVTRGSNNYGPYQFPEKLIPLAIANACASEPIPLYGSGENVRNWIHVADHCRGILAVAQRGEPGAVYNLGGDDEIDNRSLLRELLRLMNKPESLIQPVADRPGHDLRYALDSSRARRELGWAPQARLAQGLRDTVEWYRDNGEWLSRLRGADFREYYRRQYGPAEGERVESAI